MCSAARRPYHFRGDLRDAARRRLSPHPGNLVGPAGRRLAQDHGRRSCGRRQDPATALARWPDIGPELSRWRAARRAQRDRAQGPCQPVASRAPLRGPARAGNRGTPRRGRRFPQRRRECESRRLRRCQIPAPTAICSISFSRTAATSGPTATAARSKTARGCYWKSPTPSSPVWGAGRVGVHLAPRGDAHDMGEFEFARHVRLCRDRTWQAETRVPVRAQSRSRSRASARRSRKRSAASISRMKDSRRRPRRRRWRRAKRRRRTDARGGLATWTTPGRRLPAGCRRPWRHRLVVAQDAQQHYVAERDTTHPGIPGGRPEDL